MASVMVAEGLPLILSHMMPSRPPWVPFLISTTAVALFGELMPQAIMPLYIIEIGGHAMWFLKCVMWALAVPACIPAYALRRFRRWRERNKPEKADGILEADEMVEFLRLHEQSSGHGGPLTDECGSMVRDVLLGQHQMVGKYVRLWRCLTFLDANDQVDALSLGNIRSCKRPYALVVRKLAKGEIDEPNVGGKPIEQDAKPNLVLRGILASGVFTCSL